VYYNSVIKASRVVAARDGRAISWIRVNGEVSVGLSVNKTHQVGVFVRLCIGVRKVLGSNLRRITVIVIEISGFPSTRSLQRFPLSYILFITDSAAFIAYQVSVTDCVVKYTEGALRC
jgi:hypothetical protein